MGQQMKDKCYKNRHTSRNHDLLIASVLCEANIGGKRRGMEAWCSAWSSDSYTALIYHAKSSAVPRSSYGIAEK